MIKHLACVLAALLGLFALPARAALNVFACEPEWGALAQELGGDKVDVFVATTGAAGPAPRPGQAEPDRPRCATPTSSSAPAPNSRSAGCRCCCSSRATPQIQPGQPGYFEAADFVRMLEVPTQLDRAEGDVHAAGNPHIQTDPRNIAIGRRRAGQRLARARPGQRRRLPGRHKPLRRSAGTRPSRAGRRRRRRCKGVAVVVAAQGLRLSLRLARPARGRHPRAEAGRRADRVAYLAKVLRDAAKRAPAMVIRLRAYEDAAAVRVARRASATSRLVVLPFTVGGTDGAKDLFGLFDDTVARLLAGGASR